MIKPRFASADALASVRSFTGLLLLAASAANAADSTWTGAAGTSAPFWDLATNWFAGPPLSGGTNVSLGTFDTTIRSGSFAADSLQGTGTLTMTGGELSLSGSGSTLSSLDLQGGSFSGNVTVGQLQWSGGSLSANSYAGSVSNVTVSGTATIRGVIEYGDNSGSSARLTLNGETNWLDGASTISGQPSIVIGATGSFHDRADTANHLLVTYGALSNQGHYEKTGAGTTTLEACCSGFDNSGTFAVNEGGFFFQISPGSSWNNTGTLTANGGQVYLHVYRGSITQSGTVQLLAGSMSIDQTASFFTSTGNWNIASGASLKMRNEADGDGNYSTSLFESGVVHNDGHLVFDFGAATFSGGARLEGAGTVDAIEGATLTIAGNTSIGGLGIKQPYIYTDPNYGWILGYGRSSVNVSGALTVGNLEWGDGVLTVGGPVTVNGLATLSEDVRITLSSNLSTPGKRIDTPFRFNGGVVWDGNSDIYGEGSIQVAAGTSFEDQNSHGTIDPDGNPVATRIAVVSFANEGTYHKTGAGSTQITSAFVNTGTVQSVDAGVLTFTGSVNNTGTIEADRSRIVLYGALSQASGDTLSAGRYIMRSGSIVLNLGGNGAGTGPRLIRTNAADLTLDGANATLATTWLGSDVNALGNLNLNSGRLSILDGASLSIGTSLSNGHYLEVSSGSELTLSEEYAQQGGSFADVGTWIGGTLQATSISFSDGSFGAGLQGTVGTAHLLTSRLAFGNSQFDVDIASLSFYDVVTTTGHASLDGTLNVDFLGGIVTPGVYRILVADGGIAGRFQAVDTGLDPAKFRATATYGATSVDLTVSAVPEPSTVALWLAGAGLLWLRRRSGTVPMRLDARSRSPSPPGSPRAATR